MSYSYSVSDFIAGANLAYKLVRIMAESRGASEEYQEAMTELCGIQQAFIHVGQITSSKMFPQATLNSASFIVLSSMDIIARFLERTSDYRKQLESNNNDNVGGLGGTITGSWCKVGWALYRRDELRSLRDSLHTRLVAINTLFVVAREYVGFLSFSPFLFFFSSCAFFLFSSFSSFFFFFVCSFLLLFFLFSFPFLSFSFFLFLFHFSKLSSL